MLTRLKSAASRRQTVAMIVVCAVAFLCNQRARADNPHVITVMTRNLDAGTDMNYILAATDPVSFATGMAATLAEIKASDFQGRASRLADEIAAQKPDLIALQEVTLWRTGPIMAPPATEILADQLDQLMVELGKRKQHYAIMVSQSLMDAEAPVPTEGIDLRITDRDVILARVDLPRSQFEISNAQAHVYQTEFVFGSAILGELPIPRGWMSVDVAVQKSKYRFVNTHLESVYPSVPGSDKIQAAQVKELLTWLADPGMPVILAGDFNANAEPGPEHTGAVETIIQAGFLDAWRWVNVGNPGYTWPLFGEDQLSGPTSPNERIDLIFTGGEIQRWFGRDPAVVSAVRTGASAPWGSDHAGVVVTIRLK